MRAALIPILFGANYSAEAKAVFAAMTTAPTTARRKLIDACIVALKAGGVWAKLDVLYMLAAADGQAALVNWRNPGTYNGTAVNSPTFTADMGYTGNGSSAKISTGFNPSSAVAPQFVQNSATLFVWNISDIAEDKDQLGSDGAFAAGASYFVSRSSGGSMFSALNSAADSDAGVANGNGSGLIALSRNSSANYVRWRNTTALATVTSTSAAPANLEIVALRGEDGYTSYQVAAAGIGAGLSAPEEAVLYNALHSNLQAVAGIA